MHGLIGTFRVALVVSALLISFFPKSSHSATISCVTCSRDDVQAAINTANDGDTIDIPAGRCAWNGPVSIPDTKGITLRGAGVDQTIIIDNAGSSSYVLFISTTGGKQVRVTGLTFDGNAVDKSGLQGIVHIEGSCQNFRIDHIKFTNLRDRAIVIAAKGEELYGVIDHCSFEAPYNASVQGIAILGAGPQDGSAWERPLTLGTSKAVYVEDCIFNWATPADTALDAYGGARFVFRHNDVIGTHLSTHGCDSGNYRSTFSFEVYDNTFNENGAGNQRLFHFRGGTGVVFNNTATGNYQGFVLSNYRSCGSYGIWGRCDGNNPFDGNEDDTGYPCLDQIGRTTNQSLSPLYEWRNTINGKDVDISVDTGMCPEMANHIKEGRDYYDDIQMPGYTPYVYPHPLTQSAGSIPPPPGNLKAN